MAVPRAVEGGELYDTAKAFAAAAPGLPTVPSPEKMSVVSSGQSSVLSEANRREASTGIGRAYRTGFTPD